MSVLDWLHRPPFRVPLGVAGIECGSWSKLLTKSTKIPCDCVPFPPAPHWSPGFSNVSHWRPCIASGLFGFVAAEVVEPAPGCVVAEEIIQGARMRPAGVTWGAVNLGVTDEDHSGLAECALPPRRLSRTLCLARV
jgi:hypothetical protein